MDRIWYPAYEQIRGRTLKLHSNITNEDWIVPDYSDIIYWFPTTADAIIISVSAIFLTIVRKVVQDKFTKYATSCGVEDADTAHKFSESAWKTCWYIFSLTLGLLLLSTRDWFPVTIHGWEGYPFERPDAFFQYYYMFELGFYVHSLIVHFFFEIRRSDFWLLFVHHVVTAGLIYFSYLLSYYKLGVLVLVLHDVSDIPLEAAKAASAMKKDDFATGCFIVLIVSWVITRLTILPFRVIYSSMFESIMIVPKDVIAFYYPFNIGICSLQVMHFYWFFLIVKIAWKRLRTSKLSDVREKKKN